jgi:hypothetical protein
MFLNTLKTLTQKSPNDCPFIVSRDFNIDILDDSSHKDNKQQIIIFMNKLKLKSQFKNIATKAGSQLGHIWSIGSKKSPFSRGEAQSFLLLFFTFHQIWLSPIPGDHQPNYFTNLKRKTLAGN